jgi:hypothetical protein
MIARLLVFVSFLLFSTPAKADTDLETAIDRAILHLCLSGLPAHDIEPFANNPIVKNPKARSALARGIVAASIDHDINPWLMLAIAYRENSFGNTATGSRGEITVFQIVPRTLQRAREMDQRCSGDNYKGSAYCAAVLLRHWTDLCGSVRGAMAKYATGKTCSPQSKKVAWILWDRFGIASKLEKMFNPKG